MCLIVAHNNKVLFMELEHKQQLTDLQVSIPLPSWYSPAGQGVGLLVRLVHLSPEPDNSSLLGYSDGTAMIVI